MALTVSAIIFLVWFPGAYATIAGGLNLFFIIVAVDVVSGPLLTVVVADPKKPSRAFRRDVLVIALVQLAALTYGVHVMSLARPVATIFEVDRMRVISAAEIDPESLKDAPEGLRSLSWTGPRILAAATPRTREEALQAIDLAMGGLDISNMPKNWRPLRDAADVRLEPRQAGTRTRAALSGGARCVGTHDREDEGSSRQTALSTADLAAGQRQRRARAARRARGRRAALRWLSLTRCPAPPTASAEAQGSDAWAGRLLGLALIVPWWVPLLGNASVTFFKEALTLVLVGFAGVAAAWPVRRDPAARVHPLVLATLVLAAVLVVQALVFDHAWRKALLTATGLATFSRICLRTSAHLRERDGKGAFDGLAACVAVAALGAVRARRPATVRTRRGRARK